MDPLNAVVRICIPFKYSKKAVLSAKSSPLASKIFWPKKSIGILREYFPKVSGPES